MAAHYSTLRRSRASGSCLEIEPDAELDQPLVPRGRSGVGLRPNDIAEHVHRRRRVQTDRIHAIEQVSRFRQKLKVLSLRDWEESGIPREQLELICRAHRVPADVCGTLIRCRI